MSLDQSVPPGKAVGRISRATSLPTLGSDARHRHRNYAKLGLKPIRVCGRLLFPMPQVEALERQTMTLKEVPQK